MTQDNVTEDRLRATARWMVANLEGAVVVEVLEVREFVHAGSVRVGEMTITVVNGEPASMTISPMVL
mgnify:FL=1